MVELGCKLLSDIVVLHLVRRTTREAVPRAIHNNSRANIANMFRVSIIADEDVIRIRNWTISSIMMVMMDKKMKDVVMLLILAGWANEGHEILFF